MNLAAVATEQKLAIIRSQTPEVLTHTGQACCVQAKAWLVAMARSYDFSITDDGHMGGPGWLRHVWTWGPSPWPIHWCEAVGLATIDCGLFRAFAVEIFKAKGIEAYSAQVLREQQEHSTKHWSALWDRLPNSFPWAAQNFVYHEVVAVCSSHDDSCRIYDPTDGVWLDRSRTRGHNSHFAVRVESPRLLRWDGLQVGGFTWNEL